MPRLEDGDKQHPLRAISDMSRADVSVVISAFSEGLERVLLKGIEELRRSFEAYDKKVAEKQNDKPCVGSKFELPKEVRFRKPIMV